MLIKQIVFQECRYMMEGQNVLHHVWLATDEIPLNLLQKYYLTNRDCCVSVPYKSIMQLLWLHHHCNRDANLLRS